MARMLDRRLGKCYHVHIGGRCAGYFRLITGRPRVRIPPGANASVAQRKSAYVPARETADMRHAETGGTQTRGDGNAPPVTVSGHAGPSEGDGRGMRPPVPHASRQEPLAGVSSSVCRVALRRLAKVMRDGASGNSPRNFPHIHNSLESSKPTPNLPAVSRELRRFCVETHFSLAKTSPSS